MSQARRAKSSQSHAHKVLPGESPRLSLTFLSPMFASPHSVAQRSKRVRLLICGRPAMEAQMRAQMAVSSRARLRLLLPVVVLLPSLSLVNTGTRHLETV